MTQEEGGSGPLQFDRAEYTQSGIASAICTGCSNRISQTYFEVNGAILCLECRERRHAEGSSWGGVRLVRALIAGLGAAIAGSVLYWAIRAATGYELAIISIAVGFAVGKAVNWGSRGRGGRAYQVLAVLLTYMSICGNYIPDIVKEVMHQSDEKPAVTTSASKETVPLTASSGPAAKPSKSETSPPVALGAGKILLGIGALLLLAAAAPFLMGFQNIIGLFIIALGVWQAWKLNRLRDDVITGPYQVTSAAPSDV